MSAPLLAVLDYGIGNLHSAHQSFNHVGADARLTADPALIADADAVVLPGVGHFGACMRALRETGLDEIAVAAAADDRPFIGICVGMQLLYEDSTEAPGIAGLGILPGTVDRIDTTDDPSLVLPQMQWNELDVVGSGVDDPLLDGLDAAWMYFVHSFAGPADPELVTSTCAYGGPVTASVRRGSTWATQFHPEKSARAGLRLLANFVDLAREGASPDVDAAAATTEASAS